MEIDGTAGQLSMQYMGLPAEYDSVWHFLYGLHEHLLAWAPSSGMQLGARQWDSSLVNVVPLHIPGRLMGCSFQLLVALVLPQHGLGH